MELTSAPFNTFSHIAATIRKHPGEAMLSDAIEKLRNKSHIVGWKNHATSLKFTEEVKSSFHLFHFLKRDDIGANKLHSIDVALHQPIVDGFQGTTKVKNVSLCICCYKPFHFI